MDYGREGQVMNGCESHYSEERAPSGTMTLDYGHNITVHLPQPEMVITCTGCEVVIRIV